MRDRIGRYELVELLGTGSFAAVYRALDPALDTEVAIKVLADHHSAVPDIRERFISEARLLRRLSSDRLVTVHDIGEHDGQPYLVMELVRGGTLAQRLDGRSATREQLQHMVDELAACMTVVHDGGVVHRDIKPSNLLIRPDPNDPPDSAAPPVLGAGERLVLADFGLARMVDQTGLTVSGGTEGFAAPEQRTPSTAIDGRADLYAATAVLIAAMCGPGATVGELRRRIETGECDERVAGRLERGLADDPADRYQTAGEWASAMNEAVAIDWAEAPQRPAAATRERADARVGNHRSRRTIAAVAALALLTIVAAIALLVSRGDGTPGDDVDGPQIIGPDTLLIGEPGTYLHENRQGVEYRWTDTNGRETDAASIEVVPTGPDDLTISLTAIDDGIERTSSLVIRVRTR